MVNYERLQIEEGVDCKYGFYTKNPVVNHGLDISQFTWQNLKAVTYLFVEEYKIIPETVYFEFDTNYGYYDSIDTDFNIHGKRWENDVEMSKRIEREEKAAQKAKEQQKEHKRIKAENELKMYESL
mgnify:CR=1 FL=1